MLELATHIKSYGKLIAVYVDIVAENVYDPYMRLTRILTGEILEENMNMKGKTVYLKYVLTVHGSQYLNLYGASTNPGDQVSLSFIRNTVPNHIGTIDDGQAVMYGIRKIADRVEY